MSSAILALRSQIGESYSLIIKVTRACNLRCNYCHEWESSSEVMSVDLLDDITKAALTNPRARSVSFVWHGGEPLIRGRLFYEEAMRLQEKYRRDGQSVSNSLQTNGVLLSSSWVDFFQTNRWNIGLSVDGPESLHNQQRPRVNGSGSADAAMKALDLLQRSNVRYGVLIVTSEETLRQGADTMFQWIVENGINNFAFLRLRPESAPNGLYTIGKDYLGSTSFLAFQREIFDRWWALHDPKMTVREFDGIIVSLSGGIPAVCTLAGDCVGRHIGVNVNGDLYHCDRYVSDSDYFLGNVSNFDFESLASHDVIRRTQAASRNRISSYKNCQWRDVCNGGCPHDAYIAQRSAPQTNSDCCGQAELISHIADTIRDSIAPQRIIDTAN